MNDWITLDSNYYSNGGVNFGLRYNKKTGDFEIKQRDTFGKFDSPGMATLYKNGSWYSDALRITDLFTYEPGDILQSNPIPTSRSVTLNKDARSKVYAAYQTSGGGNSGLVVNSAALPQNQGGSAGTTNAVPGASAGIASAVPALSNPPGQGNILDILSPGINVNENFNVIPNPALTGEVLVYPIDLIQNYQDTLNITQLAYKAPNENLFSGNVDITSIIQGGIKRNSVVKQVLQGRVVLPIPNDANDSNSVIWSGSDMSSVTAGAAGAVSNNPAGWLGSIIGASALDAAAKTYNIPGSGLAKQIPAMTMQGMLLGAGAGNPSSQAAIKAGLFSTILNKLGFEVPAETILARGSGVIPNSNLELLFNNVSLRNFRFAFMLSPRSRDEAKRVNKIIRFFKQGMAAKKSNSQAGGATLFLGTPNVFRLEYKSGNTQIKGMNKFKICALTNFSANYSPNNQWAAYEEGQPASVIITMSFNEVEPIYDTDYQENIPDAFKNDLFPVGPDEIGY